MCECVAFFHHVCSPYHSTVIITLQEMIKTKHDGFTTLMRLFRQITKA